MNFRIKYNLNIFNLKNMKKVYLKLYKMKYKKF